MELVQQYLILFYYNFDIRLNLQLFVFQEYDTVICYFLYSFYNLFVEFISTNI
jgi:hypothetical protein